MVNSENDAGCDGVVERLGRGHLHRLLLGHDPGLQVAGDDDAERRRSARSTAPAAATGGTTSVSLPAREVPGADRRARRRPPVTKAAAMVWGNVTSAVELVSTAPKSVSSARPLSRVDPEPTGCCIQEFAARMK